MKPFKQFVSRWISIIVAWILAMLILLLVGLITVRLTICNAGFMKKQIEESSYFALVKQELVENYISYGAAGGFDSATMESLIDLTALKEGIFDSVHSIYNSKGREKDFSYLEAEFLQKLLENVEQRGITVTEEIEKNVQAMASFCAQDYIERANIPFFNYIRPVILVIQKITIIVLIGIILAQLVCLWLLFALQQNKRAGLAYVCQSFLAAAILSAAAPVVLHAVLPINNFPLNPLSLKALLVAYVQNLFNAMWPFTIAIMASTAALLVFYFNKKGYFSQ